MRRSMICRGALLCVPLCGSMGCQGDDGGGETGTDTDVGSTGSSGEETSSGSESTVGSTGSTGDPEPPDPPTSPDCQGTVEGSPSGVPFDPIEISFSETELPNPAADPSEIAVICPELTLAVLNAGTTLYRPDPWPSERIPLVVFAHGEGHQAGNYPYLFNELARRGFAVLSIATGGADPLGRAESIACALSWIGWDDEQRGGASIFDGHLTCDLVVGGHSQGGEGSFMFLQDRDDFVIAPYYFDFDPRAVFTLGTRDRDRNTGVEHMVPALIMVGALDNDVGVADAVRQYDRVDPEEDLAPDAPLRLLHLLYGELHNGFGGLNRVEFTTGNASALAAFEYIPRFLDWVVFQENVEENRRRLLFEEFSPDLADPSLWTGVEGYGAMTGGAWCANASTPRSCAARDGCAWTGSACIDLDCDDLTQGGRAACDALRSCAWDAGDTGAMRPASCVDRPMLFVEASLDGRDPATQRHIVTVFPSTAGPLTSTVDDLDIGDAGEIILAEELFGSRHMTAVAYARWSDAGYVRVPVVAPAQPPIDLSEFSYLSVRLANLRRFSQELPNEQQCEEETQQPIPIGIRLMDDDPDPGESTRVVTLRPQNAGWRTRANLGGFACFGANVMDTVRLPIGTLCQPGLDMSRITAVEFFFEDLGDTHEVFIDTIEFTRNEYDDDPLGDGSYANLCPVTTSIWSCEADTALQANELNCTDEPTTGTCGSTTNTAVALPEVDYADQTFTGWVVHAPPGSIRDPEDPTVGELAWIESQCMVACEAEWFDRPEVAANCTDPYAFETPTLIGSPSYGASTAVDDERADGSGIFTGESLSCDIQGDCCLDFDEHLCMAAPRRVTPADFPLGVGQEVVVAIDSNESKLEVTDGETVSSVVLYGDVGFSRCRDGNDTAPCPFYLGSLTAKSIGSIKIPVTCPNEQVIHRTLYWLTVNLAQPAMGIAQEGTDLVGFPAGALVFDANFTLGGGTEMDVRGTTQVDVVGTAGDTAFEFGEIKVTGMMPACWGQDDIPVEGTFEIVLDLAGGIEASPPEIEIDIPATVSCPSNVDLDAIASDPDDDLDTVRWWIDDVLMSASTTSVTFTQGHTVRAVAYDERGAATTATKTITCQ
jgi:hypothetical protein